MTASFRRIVAGGNHSIFLFDNGTALRAGVMADNQAANENPTSFESTSINGGPYSDASATWSASFLVAADRRSVHVEGCGHHAELGLGRDFERTLADDEATASADEEEGTCIALSLSWVLELDERMDGLRIRVVGRVTTGCC